MIPEFEEKILERKERTLVVQDWVGNICEISDKFDLSYLRNDIDLVIRRWIKSPVEGWEDWKQMKIRYNPNDPARFPEDFKERCSFLSNQERVVSIWCNGPFMQLREWMGFEGLCIAFIEQPDLIRDMIDFWCEYVSVMLDKSLKLLKPDYVLISEDMAYKLKSMISPKMTREFLLPVWQQWGEIIHSSGCPIFDIDSDGYIGELIPIWIEAGFNITDPVEVAAGNDLYEYKWHILEELTKEKLQREKMQ
jgi:uroporphyrinogen decarboxylase